MVINLTITSKSALEEISAEIKVYNSMTNCINLMIAKIMKELGNAKKLKPISPDMVKTSDKGHLKAWMFEDFDDPEYPWRFFWLTKSGNLILQKTENPQGYSDPNIWVEKLTEIANLDERIKTEKNWVIDSNYLIFIFIELYVFWKAFACPSILDD
jgi:hypothetical protein